jgi:CelD/BcsL family acetyltransferase involved in cellulose biosynthesis
MQILSSGPYEIQEIGDLAALEAMAKEWRHLCDACSYSTPFQRPEWLLPWCRHFMPSSLWVIALRRSGRLVGLAPFFIYERPNWSSEADCDERALALLGSGNSDYLDILLEPGSENEALAVLFTVLAAHADRWDVCDLEQLRPASPILAAPLPKGWKGEERPLSPSPVLDLPQRPENLMARLPPKQVKNLRQARRRGERLGSLQIVTADESNREDLLSALFRLHHTRWQSRGLPGVLEDETIQAFHREVAAGFARRSALTLYGLSLDGHTIGVFYGLQEKEELYFYLQGFDPEWSWCSPGVLLIGFGIEEAVRRGAACFDFLGGNEGYKYHWGAVDRPNRLRRLRLSESLCHP